ncbi:hypothetical protein WA158_005752 [Blastocystis sp. Blastoise]
MNPYSYLIPCTIVISLLLCLWMNLSYVAPFRDFLFDKSGIIACLSTQEKSHQIQSSIKDWNKTPLNSFIDSVFYVNVSSNNWSTLETLTIQQDQLSCSILENEGTELFSSYQKMEKNPYIHQVVLPSSMFSNNSTYIDINVLDQEKESIYKSSFFLYATADMSAATLQTLSNHQNIQPAFRCTYHECIPCESLYNGTYKDGSCAMNLYLSTICISISPWSNLGTSKKIIWKPNVDTKLFENEDDCGCSYNVVNGDLGLNEWSPAMYSPYKPNSININVYCYYY